MKQFLPKLRQLHGIVARIMDRSEATHLRNRYEKLIEVAIDQKMREDAYKKIMKEQNIKSPALSPVDAHYMFFMMSYNSLREVIIECRNFESVYAEMRKEGLVEALKVRQKRLHGDLSWFHNSAEYVVNETRDIVEGLEAKTNMGDEGKPETISQDDVLKRMLALSTHNLFNWGSQLEKQLRKHI